MMKYTDMNIQTVLLHRIELYLHFLWKYVLVRILSRTFLSQEIISEWHGGVYRHKFPDFLAL